MNDVTLRTGLFSSFSASSKLFPDLADSGFADQRDMLQRCSRMSQEVRKITIVCLGSSVSGFCVCTVVY